MNSKKLVNEYFQWMYQLVDDKRYTGELSYWKLLDYLFSIDFIYSMPMDENRVGDGLFLRYRFGYEKGYSNDVIERYVDIYPCSVLEVMIALAWRCEEQIMSDPEVGDRTALWFWTMIFNLGLDSMNDSQFDQEYVDDVITKFLNREYDHDGRGGLFIVNHSKYDMRDIEIWRQRS
jgi:hypothetical protein